MEIEHVNEIENLCDEMIDLYKTLDSEKKFDKIQSLIEKACKNIPDSTGITLSFQLTLDKPEEDKHIPYYEMGITCVKNETPHFFEGTSSLATYVIENDVLRIPHDRCPKCWGIWDFKTLHPDCPCCGAKLGTDVRIMLDSNTCPKCEKGTVSIKKPLCTQCGYEIDPQYFSLG